MTEMELLKGLDFGHLRHRDRDNVRRHATANTGGSWSARCRYKYTTSTWADCGVNPNPYFGDRGELASARRIVEQTQAAFLP